MLQIENVSKSYGKTLALDNLSFEVKQGEIFCLVGLNGSGKTTFFRILLQLMNPDSGKIMFEGTPLHEIDRKLLGYLPEERCLYRDMSVSNQLMFLGRLKGMADNQIIESMNKLKELLEFDYDFNKSICQLSKGNQQKVQLMGCLLHNPKIIILDEPFSGMDPYNVELLKKLFSILRKEGKYVLLSTHRLDHIESFGSSLLLLKRGKTIIKGDISEIRKASKKRVITIIDEIPLFKIKDLVDDEYILKEGNQIKIYCNDEKKSKQFMSVLLKKFQNLSITYSYPSLEELFMETKYE